jgi:hypothetical protein
LFRLAFFFAVLEDETAMNCTNSPRRVIAMMSFAACALLLASCVSTNSSPNVAEHKIDFSNYNEPLYAQVVDHIQDKVVARLSNGKNDHDRYFIIPFAYENDGNDPAFSHSFLSVIHVFAGGKQAKTTPELRTRTHKGYQFEAFTVSWLPADFPENPHLCVFEGFGGVLIASLNKCPKVPGKSFDLPTTLKLAVDAKVAVGMWGPYEIAKPGFDLGVQRMRLLNEGKIYYKADDRLTRKSREAINCFHAIANIYQLYPAGGFLNTGLNMWGLNGTKQVLREYTNRANRKHLLLEPVDIDKDIIGFVYSPQPKDEDVYDPFPNLVWAYHK